MLKYTIDGFSAIKTCLFPWPVLSVLMIFLVLVPLILWKIKLYKKTESLLIMIIMHSIIIFSVLFQFSFSIFSIVGSGITLDNNLLSLKSPVMKEEINLNVAQIALITNDEWLPINKIHGIDSYAFNSGFFELKNGQKAFVFEHLNTHAPYLLICYNNNYFIINYLQVLNLYQEIAKNNPANLNI